MNPREQSVYEHIKAAGAAGCRRSFADVAAMNGTGDKAARSVISRLLSGGYIRKEVKAGFTPIYFACQSVMSDVCKTEKADEKKSVSVPDGVPDAKPKAAAAALTKPPKPKKKIINAHETRGTGEFASWGEWEDTLTELGADSWLRDTTKKAGEASVFWEDGTETTYNVDVEKGKLIIT